MAADPDFRPWNELIPDALGLIFSKLNNGQEVLGVTPLVCKPWCKVVLGPYWLQTIDTRHFLDKMSEIETNIAKVEQVLRALLPRSSGSLRELYVSSVDNDMLSFIAEHAGSLETLDIGIMDFKASTFEQFATELGTLTTLAVTSDMRQHTLKAIVKNCKRLVPLSLDHSNVFGIQQGGNCSIDEDDGFVWSMPNLKYLSLPQAYTVGQSCIFRLLSGSPQLERVEIGGLKLDPKLVKQKYPNILTLEISGGPYFNDIREYLSHVNQIWESDSDEYGSYDDE